jgi:hypothetical protein
MKRCHLTLAKNVWLVSILFLATMQCSDQDIIANTVATNIILTPTTVTTITSVDCPSCTYVVPANTHLIDGLLLGLQPGSIIGLNAAIPYGNLLFRNIVGAYGNPIIIKSFGGTVNINGTGLGYAMKTENSKFFRITGGDINKSYGIRLTGGSLGLTLDKFSTNFEVDHLEIQQVGFAGLMAKTDPTCDDATIRPNFTMTDVYVHDNFVHDTGGEGFYIGNSFYQNGASTPCGLRPPHEIHYIKVFNNIVQNSGWEAIQVGSATKGAKIYGNIIQNYGHANQSGQTNGLQIGEGTGGLCYGNLIKDGPGHGIIVLGLGDNVVHDNVIVNAGAAGIFCDERYTPGPGFQFINNTIINPGTDGIRIYADLVPMNVIINNIIAKPGNYNLYTYPRTSQDAFVYRLSSNVKIDMANNYFTPNVDAVQFVNLDALNYRVAGTSPVVDIGKDISIYGIQTDYYKKARLKGMAYDIGATEY